MDEYFPTLSNNEVHDLYYIKHLLEGWICEIFPIAVEERNAIIHEQLRSITKASPQTNSISTEWMLSWLLKVENGCYTLPK